MNNNYMYEAKEDSRLYDVKVNTINKVSIVGNINPASIDNNKKCLFKFV